MLKILFSLFLSIAFYLNATAQTVNGVPLKDLKAEYVQVIGTTKLLSAKVSIEIDFGQENKIFKTSDTQLVNADGSRVILNSMVDALNFMHSNGYEFVTAYTVAISNQNVYHFLMRKRKV
jgi:hypothetical protein